MAADLARRLARIEASRPSSKGWHHVSALPGMTADERLRLWFGPDREAWPSARSNIVFHVNDPDLLCHFDEVSTSIPSDFAKDRGSPIFDVRWHDVCDSFDRIRSKAKQIGMDLATYFDTDRRNCEVSRP